MGLAVDAGGVNGPAGDRHRLIGFPREVVDVLREKWVLGVVRCGKNLGGLSYDGPLLILALANIDPESAPLRASWNG